MAKQDKYKNQPFAVIFDKDNKPVVQPSQADAVKLGKTDKFFWHNINYKSAKSVKSLCKGYGIDQDTIEALIEEDTRPRYFTTSKGIVFILRAVNTNPGADPDEMVSIRFWIDNEKVISLSARKIKSVDVVLEKIQDSRLNISSPMECFLEIADQIAVYIEDVVGDISDKADDLEEAVIASDADHDAKLRAELSAHRREVVSFRRYLVPLQNIFINIKSEKIDLLTQDDRTAIREIYNKITKSIEDLDYARDHLMVSFEELQGKVNVRISSIMYFFSVVTVIFLPLTFVTGLLGINVEGIPYSENQYAFTSITAILLTTAFLLVWVLKKKKWI